MDATAEQKGLPATGKAILIAGGSSVGKTSAARALRAAIRPLVVQRVDFDRSLVVTLVEMGAPEPPPGGAVINAVKQVATELGERLHERNVVTDLWLTDRLARIVRYHVERHADDFVYVWLHCSSMEELERRMQQRGTGPEDFRSPGVVQTGSENSSTLQYHIRIDTAPIPPQEVANQIAQFAHERWSIS